MRQVSFDYDGAGRVISQVLPDTNAIGFTYDPNGNLATLTPPGRTAHGFDYTEIDLLKEYDPPDVVGITEQRTFFDYNLTGDLDLVTRPDGLLVDPQYDGAGRLQTLVRPAGNTSFVYDDSTPLAPGPGKLQSITAPGGEVLTFTYDGFLLEDTVWTGTVAGTVMRNYDNFLRLSGEQVLSFDIGFLPYGYEIGIEFNNGIRHGCA